MKKKKSIDKYWKIRDIQKKKLMKGLIIGAKNWA